MSTDGASGGPSAGSGARGGSRITTALERVQNRATQVADRRAQDWATLQREVPDVAALLVAVAAAFGKPAEVRACWRPA